MLLSGSLFQSHALLPAAEKEATTQSLYEEAARIPAFQKDLQENGPEDGDAPQAVSGRDVFLAAMNAKRPVQNARQRRQVLREQIAAYGRGPDLPLDAEPPKFWREDEV